MLTEAVRDTPNPNQQSKRLTKAKKIPADAACVD
jgi:hypothetical protein